MLENGPYPYYLKKRILSDKGHISNDKSSLSIMENAQRKLKNIILDVGSPPDTPDQSLEKILPRKNL